MPQKIVMIAMIIEIHNAADQATTALVEKLVDRAIDAVLDNTTIGKPGQVFFSFLWGSHAQMSQHTPALPSAWNVYHPPKVFAKRFHSVDRVDTAGFSWTTQHVPRAVSRSMEEQPWRHEGEPNLHQEISVFAEWVRPSLVQRQAREIIMDQIEAALQQDFPGCELAPYGSSYTGLDLFDSDVDVVVIHPLLPVRALRVIAKALEIEFESDGQRRYRGVQVINAKVPIVGLQHVRGDVSVDISLAKGDAYTTSDLVRGLILKHSQFAPLALVLKVLLQQHGLHEVFLGGLGSFRLYILIAAWLRGKNRTQDLGKCLIGFLAEFNASKMPLVLVFQGRSVNMGGVELYRCQELFNDAAQLLMDNQRLSAILGVGTLSRKKTRNQLRALSVVTSVNSDEQYQATHTFKHGEKLGFRLNDLGLVTEVIGGGQAKANGVKVGDRVVKVGDAAYSVDALMSLIEGNSNYTITFQVGPSYEDIQWKAKSQPQIQSALRDRTHLKGTPAKFEQNKGLSEPTINAKLQERVSQIVGRSLQPGDIVYKKSKEPGFPAFVELAIPCIPGDLGEQTWSSGACNSLQNAKIRAAELALNAIFAEPGWDAAFIVTTNQSMAGPNESAAADGEKLNNGTSHIAD